MTYAEGVGKLVATKDEVSMMQMQLAEKQPQLEQAEFETDELMTQINKEKIEYVEPLRK